RKFDTALPLRPPQEVLPDARPTRGCNVELTRIHMDEGTIWWSFGFEAFGDITTVADDLKAVAALLTLTTPPEFGAAQLESYPGWLHKLSQKSRAPLREV